MDRSSIYLSPTFSKLQFLPESLLLRNKYHCGLRLFQAFLQPLANRTVLLKVHCSFLPQLYKCHPNVSKQVENDKKEQKMNRPEKIFPNLQRAALKLLKISFNFSLQSAINFLLYRFCVNIAVSGIHCSVSSSIFHGKA